MRFFRTRLALVVGTIALAIAVGAVGIVVAERPGAAYAQDFDTEFEGVVEAIPAGYFGVWQIGGRQVLVTELTAIEGEGRELAPGLNVEVKGFGQEGGPVLATKIEVEGDHGGAGVARDDDDDGAAVAPPPPAIPVIPGVPGVPGLPAGARQGDDDD